MIALDCPFWSRNRHRRLRAADVELMWRLLYGRAHTVEEARVAWAVFLSQRGQEHWHCDCGRPIAVLFQPLTITE